MWVLGGGLDPGRDYVFHYPNISNFSLQFGEAKSFWVPTQYLPLELIICCVKFRGILIRVIELGFSDGRGAPTSRPAATVGGLSVQALQAGSPSTLLYGARPPGVPSASGFAFEDLCRAASHTLHTCKAIVLPWGPALNLFPAQFGGVGYGGKGGRGVFP